MNTVMYLITTVLITLTSPQVYAFGSNSSSQLAMGSTDKFLQATKMVHMANSQFVSIIINLTIIKMITILSLIRWRLANTVLSLYLLMEQCKHVARY